MHKFAVRYRLDTSLDSHMFTEAKIRDSLKGFMLEPVRISSWQHLKTMYFITTDGGPAMAKMLALLHPDFEYQHVGPM